MPDTSRFSPGYGILAAGAISLLISGGGLLLRGGGTINIVQPLALQANGTTWMTYNSGIWTANPTGSTILQRNGTQWLGADGTSVLLGYNASGWASLTSTVFGPVVNGALALGANGSRWGAAWLGAVDASSYVAGDGSTSAPVYRGTDTDTGTYYPAANSTAWTCGGSACWTCAGASCTAAGTLHAGGTGSGTVEATEILKLGGWSAKVWWTGTMLGPESGGTADLGHSNRTQDWRNLYMSGDAHVGGEQIYGSDADSYMTIGANSTSWTTANATVWSCGAADCTAAGDLAVNGATSADITTTTAAASVFNTTATTLNIGGAATTIGLGYNASTTTTVQGALTATGDISAAGGFRSTVGPFVISNTAASQTDTDVPLAGSVGGGDFRMVRAGGVVGISAFCNGAVAGSSLVFEVTGAVIANALTLTATATGGQATPTEATAAAGTMIGVTYTTDGSYTSTSIDCDVWLEIEE